MKMTLTTTRTSAICFSLALSACGSDSIPCDENAPAKEYLVNNYRVSMVQYTAAIDSQSEYKIPTAIATGAEVDWNKFSIEAKANFQTYTVNNKEFPSFTLFNQVQACSPNPGTAKQKITGISITSSYDFNEKYSAGSELSSIFATVNFPYTPVADLFISATPAPKELKLYLLEKPLGIQHNFSIELTLDDGQTFLLNTGDVRLN